MKRVTASDARRNWFRLLDEVAAGEVVVIERGGRRIVVKTEEGGAYAKALPDYSGLLHVAETAEVADADRWGWSWDGPEGQLRPVEDDDAS